MEARKEVIRKALGEIERFFGLTPSPVETTALQTERDTYCFVLGNLVRKLEAIHEDPRYKAVWESFMLHGGRYTEPTYTTEFEAAQKILRHFSDEPPPSEKATPVNVPDPCTELRIVEEERARAYEALGWCLECSMSQAACAKLVQRKRKCCPDCTHFLQVSGTSGLQQALDAAAEVIRASYSQLSGPAFAKTQDWFRIYQHLLTPGPSPELDKYFGVSVTPKS